MDKEKAIDMLNALIVINNERIYGCEILANETDALDIKNLFVLFAEASQHAKIQLINEIIRIGGEPIEGNKLSIEFLQSLKPVKSLITKEERKIVLNLLNNVVIESTNENHMDAIRTNREGKNSMQQNRQMASN